MDFDPMDLPPLGGILSAPFEVAADAVTAVTDGVGITSPKRRRAKNPKAPDGIRGRETAYKRAASRAATAAKAAQTAAQHAAVHSAYMRDDVVAEIGLVTDNAGNILGIGVRRPKVQQHATRANQAATRAAEALHNAKAAISEVTQIRGYANAAPAKARKAAAKAPAKAAAPKAEKPKRQRKPKAETAAKAEKPKRQRKPKAEAKPKGKKRSDLQGPKTALGKPYEKKWGKGKRWVQRYRLEDSGREVEILTKAPRGN